MFFWGKAQKPVIQEQSNDAIPGEVIVSQFVCELTFLPCLSITFILPRLWKARWIELTPPPQLVTRTHRLRFTYLQLSLDLNAQGWVILLRRWKNCFCDKQRLISRPIGSLIRLLQGTTTCLSIFIVRLYCLFNIKNNQLYHSAAHKSPKPFFIVKTVSLWIKWKTYFNNKMYTRPGFAIVLNYKPRSCPSLFCNEKFIIFLLDLTIQTCNSKRQYPQLRAFLYSVFFI